MTNVNPNTQGHTDFVSRLDHVCAEYADKTAITYMRDDGTKTLLTFGEIREQVLKAQGVFESIGLRKGDRAAIIAPSSPFSLIAVLSLAYGNITSVLIDSSLPTEEINRLLEFSDVRAVFAVPNIYEGLDENLVSDIPVFDLINEGGDYIVFNNSVKEIDKSETADPHLDVIAILFSSGTTASMKGVMVTYSSTIRTFEINIPLLEIDSNLRYLFALPLSHIAGLISVLVAFSGSGNIGMIENANAIKLKNALIEYEPTTFVMVPRVYEIMEQRIKQEIKKKGVVVSGVVFSLISFCGFMRKTFGINIGKSVFKSIRNQVFGKNFRILGLGSSLCNQTTSKFFLSLGIYMWTNYYATTETNVPAVVTCRLDRFPTDNVGNVKRYEDIKLKIHNSDKNGIGEIRIKTALIMKGYFREPELTAAVFDEDGYFKTGDLGYIDKRNNLHVTGRLKEAIVLHTGKKVAPFDVETLYGKLFPEINMACVGVSVEGSSFDEIHIFIENVSEEKRQEIKQAIMNFSGETSTIYQVARVHFIDKLPTTSVGKVKRFKLKEIAQNES